MRHRQTSLIYAVEFSASIDCNIEQCAKPQKLYEELGCKAVYGSKSCCPKRFECPDFRKLDEDKCTLGGRQYSIGDILPRNFTDDSKCVETCICTRSTCSFPLLSSTSLNFFVFCFTEKATIPLNSRAQTATVVFRALKFRAASTYTEI